MRYSKEENLIHENLVRRMMIRLSLANESLSLRNIGEALDRNNHHLALQYIDRLRKRILSERGKRLDYQLVKNELARAEDVFAELKREMFAILQGALSTNGEKIMATKTIADIEAKLMTMKMDTGIFKRQLGTVEVDSPAHRIIKAILMPDEHDERAKLSEDTKAVPELLSGSVQDQAVPVSIGDSGEVSTNNPASE